MSSLMEHTERAERAAEEVDWAGLRELPPTPFTPTTDQVREGYASDPEAEYRDPIGYPAYERGLGRAFDRWLAARDARMKAEALEAAAAVIPERMRMNELGMHQMTYTYQLPQLSRVMLNGGTRAAAHMVKRAAEYREGQA